MRVIHEVGYFDRHVFATLTYDDAHLPAHGSLDSSELARFWKRLRKRVGAGIKYVACGEYGERLGRPHYHAIILGLGPQDREVLESAWPHGGIHVGTVTFDSIRYTMDYVQKSVLGPGAAIHYAPREVPFFVSSRGMGARYARENADRFRSSLSCTVRGVECGLPRYYRRLLDIPSEAFAEDVERRRAELEEHYAGFPAEEVPVVVGQARRQRRLTLTARAALRERLG